MQKVVILVPCYNEEGCLEAFYNETSKYLDIKGYDFSFLFVNDGSKDNTLDDIKKLREKDKRVNYISFSKNEGKEAAMYSGLKASLDSDMVIMLDSDLQHPPYLIPDMINKHEEGYKIVYTRQRSRKKEGLIRRSWAKLFYSTFNKYADVRMEQSLKDYMLLDKVVVKAFVDMPDEYRFTKGIFSYVGFKKTCLEFDYVDREIGKTKWNFSKLLKYGVNGLSQFSTIFMAIPITVSIISLLVAVMSVFFYIFNIFVLDTFLIVLITSLLFMLTNISLSFILSIMYSIRRETMKRPLYFIEESSLDEKDI